MFAVIEFGGDDANKTAVVRKDWLTPQKGEVFWPPFKLSSQFNKALSEGPCPDEERWSLYPVKRCLYFCDDLLKARQKEREAEKDSDLVTEEEERIENIRKRRKIKKPRVFVSSDSEDEGLQSSCSKTLKYPVAPLRLTTHAVGLSPSSPNREENHFQINLNSQTPLSSGGRINSFVSDEECFKSPSSVELPQRVACTPSETQLDSSLSKSGFTIVAQKLSKLEFQIASLRQFLEDNLPKLGQGSTTERVSEDKIPPLPCNTKNDVTNLEEWLATDSQNKQSLILYLGRVGGRTVDYALKKILERVFTNELAQLFNWTGKHNKLCLKGMNIVDVVYCTVRNNKATASAKDFEMEKVLRSWFRFAKDREGGREKRRNNNQPRN